MIRTVLIYIFLSVVSSRYVVCRANDSLQVERCLVDSMKESRLDGSMIDGRQVEMHKNYCFSYSKLIAPASLLALGALAYPIHEKLGNWGEPKPFKIDEYTQYAPVAAYLFSGFVDKKNKHNIWGRMQIAATAYLISAAIVNSMKYTIYENRPNTDNSHSFPSGHTATAMTGAELCRLEYGWKVGLPAYALAIVTAGLRIHNKRHWCNDLLAGTGIGLLSANAAYWLYPIENRLLSKIFGKKEKSSSASAFVMPMYEPTFNTASVALNINF